MDDTIASLIQSIKLVPELLSQQLKSTANDTRNSPLQQSINRIKSISLDPIKVDTEPYQFRSRVQEESGYEHDELVSSAEESGEPLASDVHLDSQYSIQGQSSARPDMKLSAWAPDESVERIRAQNQQYLESTNGSESRVSYQYQSYLPLHLRSTYSDQDQIDASKAKDLQSVRQQGSEQQVLGSRQVQHVNS